MAFAFSEDYRTRLLALPTRLRSTQTNEEGRAAARGGGQLEFRDHRPYSAGDDPRRLDWDAWLRLGELYTKRFHETEIPEVLVLLDRSASMGPESWGKDRLAREIAGGLLWSALEAGGHAALGILAEGGPVTLGRWRGKIRLAPMLALLEGLGCPEGPTHLSRLNHLGRASAGGRLVVLLSDFYCDPLPRESLAALGVGPVRPLLVALSSRDEEDPKLGRRGRLQCPETGQILNYEDGNALLHSYAIVLREHEEGLARLARDLRFGLVKASEGEPFEHAVARALTGTALGPC